MEEKKSFQMRLGQILDEIGEEVLSFDQDEYWMIRRPYEYLERYAMENRMLNMAIALPLARGMHDGEHRKNGITKEGVQYKLPYVIHCLLVCRMLADLHVPLPHDEVDVMLAAALCHDMIEDIPFADGGHELTTRFHMDPRVYETVKCVSKRRDFTPEEEQAHFEGIQQNYLALLVKLSDRGNNVEDLYNMSIWKIHEYVGETKKYFFPMCAYGKQHYPQLHTSLDMLEDKIVLLTQVTEILVNRYEYMENQMLDKIHAEQEENERLRAALSCEDGYTSFKGI